MANPAYLLGFWATCHFSYLRPWGPVPGLSSRALGSSLPLVLIKRIAHVRGGGCKGAAGTLPPPLTNAAERGTIEIEKESLPVRRFSPQNGSSKMTANLWLGGGHLLLFQYVHRVQRNPANAMSMSITWQKSASVMYMGIPPFGGRK